ncbi:putative dimethylaniline monooxygenase [Colletotrichum acutatum]|uniref:Dimethylaniline monooxygenase n=1 Tax=Glomerella acutata TaxID=27357 RepID=A0AAD8UDN4_GLOAC|nr:putative dimethylaniline monooxygenase [Colletotrichum acutatum]KAK1718097.1 putative dimethylaniline monooxygenase [Colletotrichum acutatum]
MPEGIRRVAVIGAGPAGAIATDALVKEQAFDVVRVFERRDLAGGTWVYTPELPPRIPSLRALVEQRANAPIDIPRSFPAGTPRSEKNNSHQLRYSDTGIHETLHSNITPEIMAFTQEPIPQVLSDRTLSQYGPGAPFRHREVIREWIEEIFTRGGHEKLIEFSTTVELAEKRGEEWVLTLRKVVPGKSKDYWWQETFDAVIVASGHFYLPYIPDIPGIVEFDEKFSGRIKHSKHFRDSEEFRGKSQKVIVVGGSVSAFDALHDIRLVSQKPVIASLKEPLAAFGWAPFTHPDITIKPQVTNFCPKSGRITFSDGSTVDEVDAVVFATGYDFSFPFLPKKKVENRRVPGLYQHVFNINDPTLAFVGMVTGGFTFRVFEWQAVAAARVFASRGKLPPRIEQEKWERERLAYKGDGIPFFTLSPDFEQYFEALRAIAGEPVQGTTGRVLPKFDSKWLEAFSEVINARVEWWKKETKKAEDQLKLVFKPKL